MVGYRYATRGILILSVFTLLAPAALSQTDLGTAQFYAGTIFGNLTASGGDAEGRLAVQGNATFTGSYSVGGVPPFPNSSGAPLLPTSSTRDDLIAGGQLSTVNAWSVNANDVRGSLAPGSPGVSHISPGAASRNQAVIQLSITTGNAVTTGGQSFAQLQAELISKSIYWSTLATTGTINFNPSGNFLTLTGTDNTLNIFNVLDTQFGAASATITINAPAGSTVLVNILDADGIAGFNGGLITLNGISHENVLYNFAQTTGAFSSSSRLFEGSVLAARTTSVSLSGGAINGRAIFGGDTNQGGGFEFHNFQFLGSLPAGADAPEPGALALLLVPGALWTSCLRRRAVPQSARNTTN